MHPVYHRFREELQQSELISPGQHVLVACSAGLDSTTLLYLLRFAAPFSCRLSVAHFDHQMRARSALDAEWLRGLCAAWEVPLHVGRAGVALRNEADARQARYQFLEQTADVIGAHLIATAHHADDQAETVLFRMLRGTGVDGLAGIPARRGRIIRPLLRLTRSELESLARAGRLRWREDPSNQSAKFARNKIRLELLPALEAGWPDARRALVELAAEAARARRNWDQLVSELERVAVTAQDANVIELARPQLLKYHPEIRIRLLRRVLTRLGGQAPGRAGTATMAAFITSGGSGSLVHLKGGLCAERDFDVVRLRRLRQGVCDDRPLVIFSTTRGSGKTTIGGTQYRIEWALGADGNGSGSVVIDPAAVRFPLHIRAWRPGDRIRLPLGTKKLKKLFAERRLGRHRRSTVPLLVDENGTILWVAGMARSAMAWPASDQLGLCVTVSDGEPF
ncbi:MAG: tRNA lysidine(34) synthetase TilS [Longimicrobiales bacterium]